MLGEEDRIRLLVWEPETLRAYAAALLAEAARLRQQAKELQATARAAGEQLREQPRPPHPRRFPQQ